MIFEVRDKDGWSENLEYRCLPQRPPSDPNLTMTEIIATLSALSPHLNRRTLNQLAIIIEAVLSMTGRVTMLGRKGRELPDGAAFF